MAQAPGCSLYMVSRDNGTPDAVWATEAWSNEAVHQNSLNLPGVRELIGQAMPLLAAPPKGGKSCKLWAGMG